MMKKIAKIATGLLLGVLITLGVKETASAQVIVRPLYGSLYGIDTDTGFFAEIPAGIVIPAGTYGNYMNMMVGYDGGNFTLTPTFAVGPTVEMFLNFEYQKHVFAFQAEHMSYIPYAYPVCAPAYQVPQLPQIPSFQLPQMPDIPLPEMPNIPLPPF